MISERLSANNFFCLICFTSLLLFPLFSCGEKDQQAGIILSGSVSGEVVLQYPEKPILVGVIKRDDSEQSDLTALDGIIKMVSVDKNDFSFRIDLQDTGLRRGEEIILIAFVDVNFADDAPSPDAGDFVGLYVNKETYSVTYTLQNGLNSGFNIQINRIISPYTAQISGHVMESRAGELTIVAYAGEINALDFSSFDPDKIIAYTRLKKENPAMAYRLEMLPYPPDLDVEDVYIFAFLDEKGGAATIGGDIIGFYTNHAQTLPELVQIERDQDFYLTDVDIQMQFPGPDQQHNIERRIPIPTGDKIFLKGEVILPPDFDPDQGELFLLVAQADSPTEIIDTPFASIFYFQKMPRGEYQFSLDLSSTGLYLADEVMVMALWDKDYLAGFPNPTPGDMAGFLQNKAQFNYSVTLSQWQNTTGLLEGWRFSLNRPLYDHQASILFNVNEEAAITPQMGDPMVAIAISANGINLLTQTIDMDYIVGITQVIIGTDGPPYSIDILPFINSDIEVFQDPFSLSDIYILAVLDINPANGKPDRGEHLGYYGPHIPFTESFVPLPINIEDKINVLETPISFTGITFEE